MSRQRLLIADDNVDVLTAGRFLFNPEGYEVIGVQSPKEALNLLESEEFDVALIDLNYSQDTTSGKEGFTLLDRIHEIDPDLPVMVMTAWASVDTAVEAMRRGARDFMQKPWDNGRLLQWVKTQTRIARRARRGRLLEQENRLLRQGNRSVRLIASSPEMKDVCSVIDQVAPTDAGVLIMGDNGVGKGLIAELLHARSQRSQGSLISVNMGGIPENLFESELFGHTKGAFTDAKEERVGRVELAADGTLFLDEIGNLPPAQQAKLLRFLETGQFERVGASRTRTSNARIVAATNADLKALADEGAFRKDLYYRLATVVVRIPSLRDRVEDILPIAQDCLDRFGAKYGKRDLRFSAGAEKELLRHEWPGNVRELNHAVERAVILNSGGLIEPLQLGLDVASDRAPSLDDMSLEEVERFLIEKTLRKEGGNVSNAARRLGMSRATFYRRIKEYGL